MLVYLNDGPANGQEINISPYTLEHYVAIPRPLDIFAPFDQQVIDAMPNYDVAIYRFMGTGFVSRDGVCSALIFQYQEMAHG